MVGERPCDQLTEAATSGRLGPPGWALAVVAAAPGTRADRCSGGFRDVDTDRVRYQIIHGCRLERPLQFLIVATSKHPEPPRRPTPLRHYLWEHVAMEMLASRRRPRWRVGRISVPKRKEVGGAERPVVVPIDRAPRTFTLLEEGEAQVAELNLPDHRIILQAHRWPIAGVELVAVTDLIPYLEDWRRDRARLRARLGMDERDQ